MFNKKLVIKSLLSGNYFKAIIIFTFFSSSICLTTFSKTATTFDALISSYTWPYFIIIPFLISFINVVVYNKKFLSNNLLVIRSDNLHNYYFNSFIILSIWNFICYLLILFITFIIIIFRLKGLNFGGSVYELPSFVYFIFIYIRSFIIINLLSFLYFQFKTLRLNITSFLYLLLSIVMISSNVINYEHYWDLVGYKYLIFKVNFLQFSFEFIYCFLSILIILAINIILFRVSNRLKIDLEV